VLEVLIERLRAEAELSDALANALVPSAEMPAEVIDIARQLLDELRKQQPEEDEP
jgi:hypothetical protein